MTSIFYKIIVLVVYYLLYHSLPGLKNNLCKQTLSAENI